MAGAPNKKIADLATETKDVHDKSWKMTSDYGVKQNNTDDWLGVQSEDKTGPMLLEDTFGREKVWSDLLLPFVSQNLTFSRSTVSTTNASQSASSMLAAPVPTESLLSSSRLQTSLLPAFSRIPLARLLSSFASQQCWGAAAPLTQSAMFVASLSSSTLKRATGILWVIISQFSSFRMR